MPIMSRSSRRPRGWLAAPLTCFTLFLAAQLVAAPDSGSPAATTQAQALLVALQHHGQLLKDDSPGTPAVSGAVARGGKIVFSGGAGSIDLENDVPATGQSVYNIGSVSKVMTAIAIMQLVEKGSIALDDDIRKYVPEFPDKGSKITIWNLVTHTSGIRHYRVSDFPDTPDNENAQASFDWAKGIQLIAGEPLLFRPGQYYSYSSYAVNLLQGVVEKASGQPFEQYMADHVWKPAGAASFSFDIPERVVAHRAHCYRLADGHFLNYYYNDVRYKFASGGMIASAEDLVRVGAAVNEDRLLSTSTRRAMFKPQFDGLQAFHSDAQTSELDFRQAILWRVQKDEEGREFLYHCGSVKAFNTCVVDYVDIDLVAAIATNSDECCGWKRALQLANLFRKAQETH
jgi:serine beta-lactamase-like protein LACTB